MPRLLAPTAAEQLIGKEPTQVQPEARTIQWGVEGQARERANSARLSRGACCFRTTARAQGRGRRRALAPSRHGYQDDSSFNRLAAITSQCWNRPRSRADSSASAGREAARALICCPAKSSNQRELATKS